jgi:hypothetical protein
MKGEAGVDPAGSESQAGGRVESSPVQLRFSGVEWSRVESGRVGPGQLDLGQVGSRRQSLRLYPGRQSLPPLACDCLQVEAESHGPSWLEWVQL